VTEAGRAVPADGDTLGGPLRLTWTPEKADWTDLFRARRRHRGAVRRLALLVAGDWALQPWFVHRFWSRTPSVRVPAVALVHPRHGITTQSDHATVQFPWSTVGLVLETDRQFVVHVHHDSGFLPLPKRGLAAPSEVDRLRALLRERSVRP